MTYTGDLGYELWVAPEHQRALFDRLWAAGQPYGMALFGFRALMSLRMEKMFGTWFREFRPIYTPLEAGMDRYLKFDHDFIGRAAVEAERERGRARALVYLEVDPDPDEPADVIGDEPIWHGDDVVGWITSGAYAHHSRRSLALGYVPAALAVGDPALEVEIIGHRRPARLLAEPVLDPAGARMRT
jgi:dimethylglycine dehydrogenase